MTGQNNLKKLQIEKLNEVLSKLSLMDETEDIKILKIQIQDMILQLS